MIFYVDASVLLRKVLGQPNALHEWYAIERGFSSALIQTECLRTLDRLRVRNQLSHADLISYQNAVLALLSSFQIIGLSQVVLERASRALPTELGTLDAIHLSTAILWKETKAEEVIMATHDEALGAAAHAQGLSVVGTRLK